MSSLTSSGLPIAQDRLTTKHIGHCIEVTNIDSDTRVDCFSLTLDGVVSPGSAPAPPETVPGLVLWLDADDASTLTTDAFGVSAWLNKASTGITSVAQSTDSLKPDATGIINGKTSIVFDTDYLDGVAPVTTAGFTVFMVGRVTDASTFQAPFSIYNSSNPVLDFWGPLYETDAGGAGQQELARWRAVRGGASSQAITASAFTIGQAHILTIVETSPTSRSIEIDSANQGTNTTSVAPLSIDSLRVGGGSPGAGEFLNLTEIGEMLVYDSVLSAGQINTIEQYLASAWGVTI